MTAKGYEGYFSMLMVPCAVKCIQCIFTSSHLYHQSNFASHCRSQVAVETTSYRENKNSASSCCSTTDYSSYGQSSSVPHERHLRAAPSVTGSSLMSSVSHSDSISKDSGFCGSVKKKEKHGSVTITYWLWGEPIPYRTSLPGKCVTLGQFKTLLPPRKGSYRYVFIPQLHVIHVAHDT